jgi:hypothetical protein
MPMAATSVMKGKGVPAARVRRPLGKRPLTRTRVRAGLAQRAASGRIGLGQKRPAGEGGGECVVTDLRRELGRRDAGLGRKIDDRAAAHAVAAARKSLIVLMLMLMMR